MEDYGAALLIQDTFAGARDSTVVIAPGGLKESFFPERKCAVFTNQESSGGYLCITAEGINLPEPYFRLIPDGINPDQFAGALYEASGLRELSRLTYTRLKLYGTTTNPGLSLIHIYFIAFHLLSAIFLRNFPHLQLV